MMVKAIYFMYIKPELAVEEFQEYWRSTHGDLVKQIPGIRDYTQCHTLLSGYGRPTPPPADGIEELSFDSLEAMEVLETSEEGQAAIADLKKFADTSRVCRIIAEDVMIKEGAIQEGMVKNIEFVTRKPGMSLEDFRHYWKNIHGPIASKIEVIKHYVQSRTLMSEYEKESPPVYDGIASTWFDDTAAMRHSATTPEYAAHHADMFNFLAGELPFIITKEIKII
jgi:uncharacterized protein (TIGR02118 family)